MRGYGPRRALSSLPAQLPVARCPVPVAENDCGATGFGWYAPEHRTFSDPTPSHLRGGSPFRNAMRYVTTTTHVFNVSAGTVQLPLHQ